MMNMNETEKKVAGGSSCAMPKLTRTNMEPSKVTAELIEKVMRLSVDDQEKLFGWITESFG